MVDPAAKLLAVLASVAVAYALTLPKRRRSLGRRGAKPPAPLPADFPVTPAKVLAASKRVAPHVHRTPVLTCGCLDAAAGRRLHFKCEVLQKTGSFKVRGATNAALLLKDAASPLVTHSSGNHAQAIALAAKLLGRDAHVVMPDTAPAVKRAAVAGYGARITLCAPTNAARAEAAAAKCAEVGGSFVHPSDDPDVIAGQGSVAVEFLEQAPFLDALVVPVGGGGLVSGIAVYAKGLRPDLKIIGAEPALVDDAARSKAAGARLGFASGDVVPNTLADGLKTLLGDNTWPVVRDLVDEIITVDEAEIADATKLVWGRMKLCIEPSAGAGVAAATGAKFRARYPPDAYPNVGVVLCGGNLDLAKAAKTLFAEAG